MGFPGAAWAGVEVDLLLDKLVEKGVLTHQEASDLRGEMAEFKDAGNKQLAKEIVPRWAQSLTISGDMRLRSEHFWRDQTTSATKTRNRSRGRLRVGAKAKVSDQLEAGFRIATGTNTDPISTNQSASDSFDKKDVFIDQAYLKVTTVGTPLEAMPLTAWGGKFENPFYGTPMVWDGDLTFEGAAVSLAAAAGPVKGFLAGGVFPLEELGANGGDPTLWGGQGGATWAVAPGAEAEWLNALTLKGAVGYYDYANLENGVDVHESSAFGNTGTVSGASAPFRFVPRNDYDYNELNVTGEANTKLVGLPIRLHGDYVKNVAIADDDEGFQLGFKVGTADKPMAWEAGYSYQRLESDAVFGLFADSDFGASGGTDRSGHVYYATLGTLNNSTLGFKWFVTEEIDGTDAGVDRLQVDWLTKF